MYYTLPHFYSVKMHNHVCSTRVENGVDLDQMASSGNTFFFSKKGKSGVSRLRVNTFIGNVYCFRRKDYKISESLD